MSMRTSDLAVITWPNTENLVKKDK